jgi:hypothetical protein
LKLWLPKPLRAVPNAPFSPTQISSVKRWYRLAASTAVSGEYPAVEEVLGGTDLAQTSANRKPAAATSANGLPVATFDGSDLWLQTLESGNNGTAKWWAFFYFKAGDLAAAQRLYGCRAAGGASANRVDINLNTDGSLSFFVFVSALNGRSYTTAGGLVTAGAWCSGYVQFDGTQPSEVDLDGATATAKSRVAVNGDFEALVAADVGTGGAVTGLVSATGTAIFGATNDVDAPVSPFRNNGQLGPNLFFGDEPLTALQFSRLVAFEVPT